MRSAGFPRLAWRLRSAAQAASDVPAPVPPPPGPGASEVASAAERPWSTSLDAKLAWLQQRLARVSSGNPHRLGAELQLSIAERWIERVREDEPRGVATSAITAVYAEREYGNAAVYLQAAAAWDRHVLGRHDP